MVAVLVAVCDVYGCLREHGGPVNVIVVGAPQIRGSPQQHVIVAVNPDRLPKRSIMRRLVCGWECQETAHLWGTRSTTMSCPLGKRLGNDFIYGIRRFPQPTVTHIGTSMLSKSFQVGNSKVGLWSGLEVRPNSLPSSMSRISIGASVEHRKL